ncbi:MAG: GFA family protein [Lysobacter sp.]|nr:GFA family protein [Lysobacter sp.]
MTESHGGCLCGAVGFSLDWPSKWVAHCHCTQCRRAHGAAFVTWIGMAEDRVRIDDAESQLRWFASSPGAERGFCARCGSSLFFRSARWPGELHIAHGNLNGDADRAPMAHVFWDTHVGWASVDATDALPRIVATEVT